MGRKLIDLTGQRFKTFTVVSVLRRQSGGTKWLCRCDCGATAEVYAQCLKSGNFRCSCHAVYSHPLYGIWRNMIDRCTNPKSEVYANYGGRGIKVCERWTNSFRTFVSDMPPRPDGTSIDRINNNGDYSPSNCKWSTVQEQNSNKRTNVYLTYLGETKTMAEWARALGISREGMRKRINKRVSEELMFHYGRI